MPASALTRKRSAMRKRTVESGALASIPWHNWLRAAVLHYGLTPQSFWRMSIKEWRMINDLGATGALPLTRDEYEQLTRFFPDV